MSEKKANLTDKQQRFADEYIISLNATEAYMKAYGSGTSYNSAMVSGHRLIRNPKIKQYISDRLGELNRELVAEQEEVLGFLTAVLRGETKSSGLIGLGGGEEGLTDEIGPSTSERIKAAELLGKRYALFTDNQNVNAVVTPIFVDDIE